jgi:hypothetical protein
VVVVRDAGGQVVGSKTVKPAFLRYLDRLEALQVGDVFAPQLVKVQ